MLRAVREWLFGVGAAGTPGSRPGNAPRARATALIHEIAHGGVRDLGDEDLVALVDLVLADPGFRTALRGNVRFLSSVSAQFARKRTLSARQRQGLLNVFERAYPHNLAAELRRL